MSEGTNWPSPFAFIFRTCPSYSKCRSKCFDLWRVKNPKMFQARNNTKDTNLTLLGRINITVIGDSSPICMACSYSRRYRQNIFRIFSNIKFLFLFLLLTLFICILIRMLYFCVYHRIGNGVHSGTTVP